jgi:hypothetical protein
VDINEANVKVSGGPGSIELGGVTYLVGQPDDRLFTTLHDHCRKQAKNPIQAIADDLQYLPAEYRKDAIKAAVELKSGGGAELTAAGVQEYLFSPAGCAFLTWLMIRKEQPDVKLETIRPHVTETNVHDILAQLGKASGLEAVMPGKVGRGGS